MVGYSYLCERKSSVGLGQGDGRHVAKADMI